MKPVRMQVWNDLRMLRLIPNFLRHLRKNLPSSALDLCEQTMRDPQWCEAVDRLHRCPIDGDVFSWNPAPAPWSCFTARLVVLKLSCNPQTASSVERLPQYENCSGSSEAGNTESLIIFSKHFLKMGSSAMRRQSFKHVISACFGLGTMMDVLKHEGTTDRQWERLKTSVKTHDNWSTHALSTRPGMPSRPADLRIFTRRKDQVTESVLTKSSVCVGGVGSFEQRNCWARPVEKQRCSQWRVYSF